MKSDTKIKIPICPISINTAWQGRRFKTPKYIQYEEDVKNILLQYRRVYFDSWVLLAYKFWIKNYKMTDVGNLEKALTDIVVSSGILKDDRYIKKITLEKFPAETKNDQRIELIISEYDGEDSA